MTHKRMTQNRHVSEEIVVIMMRESLCLGERDKDIV